MNFLQAQWRHFDLDGCCLLVETKKENFKICEADLSPVLNHRECCCTSGSLNLLALTIDTSVLLHFRFPQSPALWKSGSFISLSPMKPRVCNLLRPSSSTIVIMV